MKMKASISVTTLTIHEVAIDLKKVSLKDGKGTFTIEEDTDATVAWRLRGAPQQKYKIEIKPEDGKLVMRGDAPHPIELKIPRKYNLGAGNRVFRIAQKKKDE